MTIALVKAQKLPGDEEEDILVSSQLKERTERAGDIRCGEGGDVALQGLTGTNGG